MTTDLVQLSRRLERAQATQNERLNQASGGTSMPLGGGFVHVRGDGHPLNQALGLIDPITGAELQAAEALLAGSGGSPVVIEVSPAADGALWPLLGSRGYRVQQFQLLWSRELRAPVPAAPTVEIRLAEPDEELMFSQLVGAAFCDLSDWRQFEPPFSTSLRVPGIVGCIASVNGEPAGGAVLGMVDGVALLSGDGVLGGFRGRGIQKALIAFRLNHALAQGCDIACASTLPLTPSQRAYESSGFRASYPKLEMVRD
jgi:GNAT superfamily N-acetyltransferase